MDDQVVDAHGDKVDADAVVIAGIDGDFKFGADTIRGGDQYGIGETGGPKIEKPAKAAQCAVGARARGAFCQRFDRLDQGIAGIDVDTRILVGQAVSARLGAGTGRVVGCYGSLPSLHL